MSHREPGKMEKDPNLDPTPFGQMTDTSISPKRKLTRLRKESERETFQRDINLILQSISRLMTEHTKLLQPKSHFILDS